MKRYIQILALIILCLNFNQLSSYAQDSLSFSYPVKKKVIAEPLRATMLAIAFPGMGQIYNKKLWKIPLVYAGFGGLIYSVSYNSSNYIKYMKAYQDFTDDIPETKSYQDVILYADPATYDPVLHPDTYNPADAAYYKEGMLRFLDSFKRYRDLSYIGIAGWYLISILDANVDASLFNYDISENLDLAIVPMQFNLPGGYFGAGVNVGLTITF